MSPIPDCYAQPIYDRTSLRAAVHDYHRLASLLGQLGRHIVQRANMLDLRDTLDPDCPDWTAIEEELRNHEGIDPQTVLPASGRRPLEARAHDRITSGG